MCIFNRFSPVILLLALLFSLPSAQAGGPYSGQDLFKAIYFADGPAAGLIPELQGFEIENYTTDAAQIQRTRDFQQQVINQIQATQPAFFTGFGEVMTSGNHYAIDQKLDEGDALLKAVLPQLGYTPDADYQASLVNSLMTNVDFGRGSVSEITQAIQAHFQYLSQNQSGSLRYRDLIFDVWYVWIIVHKFIYETDDPTEMRQFKQLYREQLVASIATRF